MLPGCIFKLIVFLFSSSDVTAFLACEHLTTLSLAHARGEIERPEVGNEAGGLSTSRLTLRASAPQETPSSRSSTPTATMRPPPAPHRCGSRRRGRRHRSGCLRGRRLARRRRLPDEAVGRQLRGARYQARAPPSPPTSPAPLLQRAARAGSRVGSRPTSNALARLGRAGHPQAGRVRRLRSAPGSSSRRDSCGSRRRPTAGVGSAGQGDGAAPGWGARKRGEQCGPR